MVQQAQASPMLAGKVCNVAHKRSAVTIKDIAQASGVSYPTVSYVLNNSRPVAPATRKRVLDAVSQLNYHPSAVARGLLKQRMNTVGIVLPYSTNFLTSDPYLGPIIEGIVGVTQAERQSAMLFTSLRNGNTSTLDGLPLYCDGRSDGILFIHEPTENPLIQAMRQTRVPFVCINELQEGSDVSGVDAAQEDGAERLTEYLIRKGHKRIGFFPGGEAVVSARQREIGFTRAMQTAGLPIQPAWNLRGEYDAPSGYERAYRLWKSSASERPTALVCCNDLIAFGAIQALREMGVSVPGDVSVVGFDDIPASARHHPPLTTMRLPFREGGAKAAEMLLRHITDGAVAEQELLPMTLIERQTVAAPSR